MEKTIIQVEHLSKAYRIGVEEEKSDTLAGMLWQVVNAPIRNLKTLIRLRNLNQDKESLFWALHDVNFEVKKGEALGIIGKNGAGKSTLLKILSRITEPTSGKVTIQGRVSSLLEVGTGFHPDLTGMENIYMNGTILGMRKKEIDRKLDEIIAFSGISRYIDTPVKRYSSGMTVRLAFSVAAHLDPEILIIDEVLAVGDAEFQKKCLGKMKDVSTYQGRTVLFVSHNMTAMNSLCNKVVYLKNGRIELTGDTSSVISTYLSSGSEIRTRRKWKADELPGDCVAKLMEARLINRAFENIDVVGLSEECGVEFKYNVFIDGYCPTPNLHLFNQKGDCVFVTTESSSPELGLPGTYKSTVWIPPHLLNDGRYIVGIATTTLIPQCVHFFEREALIFDVIEDMSKRPNEYRGAMPGVIRPDLKWITQKI